ncbi:unnamed protein product [Meloidogyne enterolobii]|uniref:Uncharacterized protein n=1 Tax=Meloidogyne enterolobii TaxID=390850 RepID=A0ACB0ZGB8_MELEN
MFLCSIFFIFLPFFSIINYLERHFVPFILTCRIGQKIPLPSTFCYIPPPYIPPFDRLPSVKTRPLSPLFIYFLSQKLFVPLPFRCSCNFTFFFGIQKIGTPKLNFLTF